MRISPAGRFCRLRGRDLKCMQVYPDNVLLSDDLHEFRNSSSQADAGFSG
jgi:hypothetical protein